MKKLTLLTIALIVIFNMFSISYGAENNYLRAKFSETDISGTNFKEITINPSRYQNGTRLVDEEDVEYYIYLPSGYLVQGKTASFVADQEGKYPFTVYYGSYKKTFFYTVDDIEEKENTTDVGFDDKDNEINFNYDLKYDYEKKQILFHISTDKLRTVTTPESTTITNEVNYYIENLENNIPFEFKIVIDDESFNYKIIKQGEFYLLVELSSVNYDNYSTLVEYKGYNFTNNNNYEAYPSKDLYEDNGNYEVLVKSDTGYSKSLFVFNIDGIDYRRPNVDVELEYIDDYNFYLEIEDDFGLDYMITFDGKYIPIRTSGDNKEFTYTHNTAINYNGEYIFTIVDKAGNRTVEKIDIDSRNAVRKHKINLDVHDYKYTENLFRCKGLQYTKNDDDNSTYYKNILPAYMSGCGLAFNPNSSITRAEMVTVFCRLNDLPYDINAYFKTKFTDIDNHWAKDYISMGSSKKYISGYKDKTFKPDSYVTRAEFCQMLTKISAYKTKLNELPASSNYDFNDISAHWAEKEIIKISSRDLIESTGNYFYPDKPITRAEVAHAVNKLYGFSPSYLELNYINSLYNKYYNFTDIKNNKNFNDIIISVVGMYREKIE
ncbi:MAG: S-layer homology domain-containing protein [Sedimentibacter sp.]|uniref:S-layer homology domain-containing protein n=1 Tax=Sedimentibacter sp. TaxID=1960295 RepID=UPI002982AC99|nr:S-layer homology domain-containing protein [Sedimentibacter sp.]MDW5300024.1 S-layer homology domain-containing protein [Sedimentibacter sp.]